MTINTDNDCFDSIVTHVNRSTIWRRRLQAKFPDDPRNERAADTLAKIATEATGLSQAQWAMLKPFYNWASATWLTALSDAARHIGFQCHARSFDAFVEHLTFILNEQKVAA